MAASGPPEGAAGKPPYWVDDEELMFPPGRKVEMLKQLWAGAYDGWTDVTEMPHVTLYLRPISSRPPKWEPLEWPLLFQRTVTQTQLFALTGFNPMGEKADIEANKAANARMEKDLETLDPKPRTWWKAFGFAEDWREDGFVLAYAPEEAEAARAAVVELAKKYKQGAIYAYEPLLEPPRVERSKELLLRRTIAAAMPDTVEENAVMERCGRPDTMRFSKPIIPDEEYPTD